MEQIAHQFGCNHATIVNRMKKYGIKSRGHLGLTKPINISKEKLEYLYKARCLSAVKIAKILHCSKGGIERKINKFGIATRGINNRTCKYKKKNFSGNFEEKAYMIGFRLGDLNVYKRKNVIVARCSTTKKAQSMLIKNLFSPYGGITISKAKRGTIEIVAYLNSSFEFLIPKKDEVSRWIIENNQAFLAFFAGYADAEGCLYLHRSNGKRIKSFSMFEINSYDRNILNKMWEKFRELGIIFPPVNIGSPKGTPCGTRKNYLSNGDSWRLATARKESIWKLINYWGKYSQHLDKKKAITRAEENIINRNRLPYCQKIDLTIPKVS